MFLQLQLQTKQCGCVAVGGSAHVLGRNAERLGDEIVDVGDVGALVALATVGLGCQIRGIRFQQQAVEADDRQQLGHGALLECDHTIHAKVEVPPAADTLNVGRCFNETVEDTLRHWTIKIVDDIEDVVESIAAMHDERHTQFVAPMELDVECMPLLLAVGLVPIKVDADFADCYNGILIEQGAHLAEHVKVIFMHVLGVHAQRHRDVVGILLTHGRQSRNALQVLVRQDDVAHARFTGPLHNRVPVLVERVTINMRMRIYHS